MLQLQLRRQIIGERFWIQQAQDRANHPEQCKQLFVKVLQQRIVANTDQFNTVKRENSLKAASSFKKKIGTANEQDIINNNNRKQSLLLTAFNMKAPSAKGNSNRSVVYCEDDPNIGSGTSGKSKKTEIKKRPSISGEENNNPDAGARKRRSSLFNKPKLTK
jgi:hypothetical protein